MLHYQTFNAPHRDADWIVMIHGAGGSTRTWKKQVEDFKSWYNLLVIDLPGHGYSKHVTIDDRAYNFEFISEKIWDVVDHLNLSRVHLMGVSLGSIIGMQMKALRPFQVSSLIMAGAIVRLDMKMRAVASGCLTLAKWIGYPRFYKIAAKVLLPKANHKKSRDIFIRESRHLTTEEFSKWTSMYGMYLNKTLKQLFEFSSRIPTLCVMGAQDHMFLGQARKYVEKHAFATLEVIQKAGHLSNLERPLHFNQLCLAYLEGLNRKMPQPALVRT
jgi:pimeloyl-ACP methyl ester carboxylesterase